MAERNKTHILVIEDSPDLQSLLAHFFKSEGYKLSQAYNGHEALELLRAASELPSVILLDVMMPVMSGFEFREAQLKDPRLVVVPVLVMTADPNAQAKARLLGMTHFVRKPIEDVDQLLEIIDSLC